jgi:hypothetical protein
VNIDRSDCQGKHRDGHDPDPKRSNLKDRRTPSQEDTSDQRGQQSDDQLQHKGAFQKQELEIACAFEAMPFELKIRKHTYCDEAESAQDEPSS